MQSDGNLVVYSTSHAVLWSSHTGGQTGSVSLSLRDDAALLVKGSGGILWSVMPRTATLPGGQSLLSGQHLIAADGLYSLHMQSDGNLVEYTAGRPLWSTGTVSHPGSRVAMQRDGNLVVYASNNAVLWSSGTNGHSGSISLVLSADGSLNVYGPTGRLWTNHV